MLAVRLLELILGDPFFLLVDFVGEHLVAHFLLLKDEVYLGLLCVQMFKKLDGYVRHVHHGQLL
jgi:hypothetical protein